MKSDAYIQKINKVIDSSLLIKDLTFIPSRGATMEEIKNEEKYLSHNLLPQHVNFLRNWNGIDLDIIRIFGCGVVEGSLETLRDNQDYMPLSFKDGVIFASDPSGFLYIENSQREIFYLDTDGGEIEKICSSFGDFIDKYLFGIHADIFFGKEWHNQLMESKII